MNLLVLTLGLLALSTLSFAEKLSQGAEAVLTKIRSLKNEEKLLLASITDEEQKDLVEEALDSETEDEDKKEIAVLEKELQNEGNEEAHQRSKRRASAWRARVNHRVKLRRNRRLSAHRRRAHAARRRANRRRARRNLRIKRIRALQKRRG